MYENYVVYDCTLHPKLRHPLPQVAAQGAVSNLCSPARLCVCLARSLGQLLHYSTESRHFFPLPRLQPLCSPLGGCNTCFCRSPHSTYIRSVTHCNNSGNFRASLKTQPEVPSTQDTVPAILFKDCLCQQWEYKSCYLQDAMMHKRK